MDKLSIFLARAARLICSYRLSNDSIKTGLRSVYYLLQLCATSNPLMLILGRSVGDNNVNCLVPLLLDLLLRFFTARELGRPLWFSGPIGTSQLLNLALSIKILTSGLIDLSRSILSSTLICYQLLDIRNGELINDYI